MSNDIYGNPDNYSLFFDNRVNVNVWYPTEYANHPLWSQYLTMVESYATKWVGTANASPSQRISNGTVRTNLVSDPDTTATTLWTTASGTSTIVNQWLRITPSTASTTYIFPAATATVTNGAARFKVDLGDRLTMRAEVRNPTDSASAYRIGFAYYTSTGAASGATSILSSLKIIQPGETQIAEISTTVPTNVATTTGTLPLLYLYNVTGGSSAATDILETTHWTVETGSTAPTQSPYIFFDGDVPNSIMLSTPRPDGMH